MINKVRIKKEIVGVLFVLPALFFLFLTVILPILRSIYLSFFSWNMLSSPKFIGFENYTELFEMGDLLNSIFVTIKFLVIVLPISIIFGFIIALAMSNEKKINVIYRTIFFSPRVTSTIAISAVWLYIFHPQFGLPNKILQFFRLPPVGWLNVPKMAVISISIFLIWKAMAFSALLYVGALQNMSQSIMEAAIVDGANAWQRIKYFKIPLVSPTTFMLVILQTIDILKMFSVINVMTNGGPNNATQTMVVLLYKVAFSKFRIGLASAISIVLLVTILLINLVQMQFEKKVHYE